MADINKKEDGAPCLPDVPAEAPGQEDGSENEKENTGALKPFGEGDVDENKCAMADDAALLEDGKLKQKESHVSLEDVVFHLRDINQKMVEAWVTEFAGFEQFKVSKGDIFKEAPAADAIVSPANSFGFMDGGIDMVYTRHFGWQLQRRLQSLIREQHDSEVLVGQAVVLPAYEADYVKDKTRDWSAYNQGQLIRYVISAPTMRVPLDVSTTANAYLAFRAVILAVRNHNREHPGSPIRSVLCPGLGTAVGQMPKDRCALQMRRAYEVFVQGKSPEILSPPRLVTVYSEHEKLADMFKNSPLQGSGKKKDSSRWILVAVAVIVFAVLCRSFFQY